MHLLGSEDLGQVHAVLMVGVGLVMDPQEGRLVRTRRHLGGAGHFEVERATQVHFFKHLLSTIELSVNTRFVQALLIFDFVFMIFFAESTHTDFSQHVQASHHLLRKPSFFSFLPSLFLHLQYIVLLMHILIVITLFLFIQQFLHYPPALLLVHREILLLLLFHLLTRLLQVLSKLLFAHQLLMLDLTLEVSSHVQLLTQVLARKHGREVGIIRALIELVLVVIANADLSGDWGDLLGESLLFVAIAHNDVREWGDEGLRGGACGEVGVGDCLVGEKSRVGEERRRGEEVGDAVGVGKQAMLD